MHRTKFLMTNEWTVVQKGSIWLGSTYHDYTIIKEKTDKLDFELYCVDIYGLLDRESIYSYPDDIERFMAFQIAVLDWMSHWLYRPDIVHVHDHHTAMIPFMMHHCYGFSGLSGIKTVLTIHNAQYQGWMGWDKSMYIPAWDTWKTGLLEWDNSINPLACGIKCANKVTTVSPGYMNELRVAANGLEHLFYMEGGKCTGIINGIDYAVWDPLTDTYILDNFSADDVTDGKELNKKKLCDDFGFDAELPLFVFIGRLVGEKAADLLPVSIAVAYELLGRKFSFLILGSGEPVVEQQLQSLQSGHIGYYNTQISYNEKLSHQMYAGADFLLMPSRVEPCGLNQLYAMRYGTVPVVRRTGGLQDTVIDFGDKDGYGICFNFATVEDIVHSMGRALSLYEDAAKMEEVRLRMMRIESSWESSALKYIDLYLSI
jgi:starch synthase